MSVRVPPAIAPRRAQQGVILFIALIVLVAMSLAGIALMRSVDTNVLIAGNLAFRQGATLAGDRAFEDPADGARAFLLNPANKEALKLDQSVPYYWANWQSGVNMLTNFDWSGAGVKVLPDNDGSGNEVRYVIHRMCKLAGSQDAADSVCVKVPSAGSDAGTKGSVAYGVQVLPGTTSVYYRVTVRIQGPRNTVSYVQAMLN